MKINILAASAAIVLAGATIAFAAEPAPALVYHPSPGEELDAETSENIDAFLAELKPLQGAVDLNKAKAVLTVPATHYFLGPKDARAVLEDAWGNPPDPDVLGMIFPTGSSPIDDTAWGAAIYFSDDGYVSDEDADDTDYVEMMRELQKSQVDDNKWRTENGYEPIEMIGWAETPAYNPETHKLYWAKEMKFGESDVNTLNYDIRVLGRRGTLVISFIATMDQLPDIRQSAPSVLNMAHFNSGSTYADYQPGVDKKAAYGIAGLIGGAAIVKKTGLLAALLVFGKKFIIIILAGLAGMFGVVKKFFSGRQ